MSWLTTFYLTIVDLAISASKHQNDPGGSEERFNCHNFKAVLYKKTGHRSQPAMTDEEASHYATMSFAVIVGG
jgi:hypothetical protein